MKLETLHRLLQLEKSGKPCGRLTPEGECQLAGLLPTGRCYMHGAAALRGPRLPKRKLTKKEQKKLSREVMAMLRDRMDPPDCDVEPEPAEVCDFYPTDMSFMD